MENSIDPLLSPSKAARVISESRAWSEIHGFLAPLFHPKPIPPFERNSATLSALQNLISHSEAQTERNALLASTQAEALAELSSPSTDPTLPILEQIEGSLTEEGLKSLNDLATLSSVFGCVSVDPRTMAQSVVNLTRSENEISQQLQRVEILHQQLKLEHVRAQELLQKLRNDDSFQQSDSVSQRTKDWSRGTKQMSMKIGEYKDRASRLERAGAAKPEVGIPEIKGQEKELRDLEKRVRGLEGRVRGFEELPPDKDLALLEVERMRRELEGLVRKRDVSRLPAYSRPLLQSRGSQQSTSLVIRLIYKCCIVFLVLTSYFLGSIRRFGREVIDGRFRSYVMLETNPLS